MPDLYTWGQLKTEARNRLWPDGEQDNLITSHDKMFVDGMVDVQTWAQCFQQDNTDVIDQCATFYNCGLTVLDAPRGAVKKVSVIDRIDPATCKESPDVDPNYCREIVYSQINPVLIRQYLGMSQQRGCCLSIPFFFALPWLGCGHARYPVPTNEGLPAGLPVLPLGYSYPQDSTDRKWGRSHHGVWAIERGKMFLAPWIQSTETIIRTWDGIKSTWADADIVDSDPLLSRSLEHWVRWHHADQYDNDEAQAQAAAGQYNLALQALIHACREQTRVRYREPSQARASSVMVSALFYNEQQSATVSCPAGQTGNPVTVTIPAGTVGSNKSVSDANKTALTQAQTQAQAQLVCATPVVTYWNTAQTATAACDTEAGAPTPIGTPVTVTVDAHTVSSTVSQADADSKAQQLALSQAKAQRACTYGNRAQTAVCPYDSTITHSVPADKYHSTLSQADADQQAITAANNLVATDLNCLAAGNGTYFLSTQQQVTAQYTYQACVSQVILTVPAGAATSLTSQADANGTAIAIGNTYAHGLAQQRAMSGLCGLFEGTYPVP